MSQTLTSRNSRSRDKLVNLLLTSMFYEQEIKIALLVAKCMQHVAPNNVVICCIGMLRSFGRGLTLSPCKQALGKDICYLHDHLSNKLNIHLDYANQIKCGTKNLHIYQII